ncbi:MAG: Holliday junction branch migration protein RuvA [Nocardioidaceae bacterium]|nr:Holliday junction branch migration protein RuvA [Nocardioidaceae bacterium]
MIAFVRGQVAALTLSTAVVEVGGVGMQVLCTPTTLARLRLGQEARISTSMVVREDSLTLYGFADDDERDMFELAQTATGVGPKMAQSMLATLSPDELRTAVAREDLAALTTVSGIGRKGAQRIVLELKDRIGPATGAVPPSGVGAAAPSTWKDQVHTALVGLGWSTTEAELAVSAVADQAADQVAETGRPDVPALLRSALRSLARS